MKNVGTANRKIPYAHIPAWLKLNAIGLAIEQRGEPLPSVRRDSPEWAAWTSWFVRHGMPTQWANRQPADRMMTVTMLWPPSDDELNNPKLLANSAKELKE